MKFFLLLLSFFCMSSAIAQNTIQINTSQYDLLKKNGLLDPNVRYAITGSDLKPSQVLIPSESNKASRSTCDCMIPLDGTFTTTLAPNDDLSTGSITLPFTFNLYGVNYTSLYINNNGNVSFGTPYGTFSSLPFPDSTYVMIAPFWGDVDTRAAGSVHHKVTPTHIIVKWESVGYYSLYTDKLNTFQLILTDGTDTLLPAGNNVGFCYGDMQWTTGDASGGAGTGFGGIPATVGVNSGNGTDYFQVGRFDTAGLAFDGPYGASDEVDWLDEQIFYFNTAILGNIPPLTITHECDTIDVLTGDTTHTPFLDYATFRMSASTPEIDQTISVSFSCSAPAALSHSMSVNTPNYKQYDCVFSAIGLSPGVYSVTITATDDGTPVQSSSKTVYIRTQYDPSVMTSINDPQKAESIHIYPNPSNGSIKIVHPFLQSEEPVLLLTDLLGKKMISVTLNSGEQTIDISTLPTGVYFATITTLTGETKTLKLIRK